MDLTAGALAALSPVSASSGAIAKTFWGRAWCQNLEQYSDYSNRLPRGCVFRGIVTGDFAGS